MILSSNASSSSTTTDGNSTERIVPKDELFSFIVRCMLKVGTRPSHAEVLADNLSMADYRGNNKQIMSLNFEFID